MYPILEHVHQNAFVNNIYIRILTYEITLIRMRNEKENTSLKSNVILLLRFDSKYSSERKLDAKSNMSKSKRS